MCASTALQTGLKHIVYATALNFVCYHFYIVINDTFPQHMYLPWALYL